MIKEDRPDVRPATYQNGRSGWLPAEPKMVWAHHGLRPQAALITPSRVDSSLGGGPSDGDATKRKPTLSLRLDGCLLSLRFDTRSLCGLLLPQPPPRHTRGDLDHPGKNLS